MKYALCCADRSNNGKNLYQRRYGIRWNGKEPFCGDIVINGSTIEAVLPHCEDRFYGKNGRLILAQGLAVTPGFVDVHRHCDLAALTDPDFGRQELKQGITSVLAGNCGIGLAPSSDGSRAAMYRF